MSESSKTQSASGGQIKIGAGATEAARSAPGDSDIWESGRQSEHFGLCRLCNDKNVFDVLR